MALESVEIWIDGHAEKLEFVEGEIDYISFINDETYGKPPLITSDVDGRPAVARDDDNVLYINTSRVAAVKVRK